MSRNLRNREHPAPNPVDSYPVAPDRFSDPNWSDMSFMAKSYDEWKKAQPYKAGDVVWLEYGKEARKAFISDVWPERDYFGDRRAKYRVHVATAKGDRFAKNWFYTWPGFIQRGYQLAAKQEAAAA